MTKLDRMASELMGALLVAQGESNKISDLYEDRIEEALGMRWLQLIAAISKPTGNYVTDLLRARNLLDALATESESLVRDGLASVATSARKTTRQAFRNVLPQELYENEIVSAFIEAAPKRRLKKRTIEPMTEAELRQIVQSSGFAARLRKWRIKLTRNDRVARILAQGIANGLSANEIALSIAPHVRDYVKGVETLLRTEASRVHNQITERTFRDFGDLVVGYQIIAILDEVTRPHHATRHGKIWYVHKQPFASERPELPDEPNCRCTYTVLLRDGTRGYGVPLPSSRMYRTWFDRQRVSTKQRIVGKRRWATVKEKIDRPSWNDFINPSTGRLLKLETLENKSAAAIKRTREQLNSRQKKQAEIARGFK